MKWRSLGQIITVITLIVLQPLFGVVPSLASMLTSASLTLTNQHTSETSGQTLEFVTPTGVDASTDTVVIEYESGFTLSSLSVPGDFDLAVDDDSACDGPFADKTLAASAAAGTWGVSVSGQLITFTAPTDAASGEITAGRCVQIQIGSTAAGGTNNITNPSTGGSYEVDVYGTFGDHAMYAVGMQGTSAFTVSATVNVTPGGGPSPGPGPAGDTTSPIISNIIVSNITTNSATVSWTTDEAAETVLSYGLTTSYAQSPLPDTLYRTSHTRNLTGLLEASEYHFQIWASDNSSNASNSTDLTFTTVDATPPVITNLVVSGITETTATVTWDTDEPATSNVSGSFGLFSDPTLVTTHSILLTGLTPGTSYIADVFSLDASGNFSLVSTTFTTSVDLPPTNVVGFQATPGNEVVSLTWSNPPDPDFTNVSLRFKLGSFPTSITDGTQIYNGPGTSFSHTGLTNGTEYFYSIFAIDLGGNVSSGASDSATPIGSSPPVIVTPPTGLLISNLQVTNITQKTATVTWSTSAPADSVVNVTTVGPFSNTALVINHSVPITGLIASTAYSLSVSSTDSTPQIATAAISFTTPAVGVIPPVVPPVAPIEGGAEEGGEEEGEGEGEEKVVPPEPEVLIPRTSVEFLVARDSIVLSPTSSNQVRVLGGRGLAVNLDLVNAPADIVSVQLGVGSSTYLMNRETSIVAGVSGDLVSVEDEKMYSARIITPSKNSPLTITVNYITGEAQVIRYSLAVQSEGIVTDADSSSPLGDTNVSLFKGGTMWNAIPFNQVNPVRTGSSGAYSWYVPNGTYKVEASKSGYNLASTAKITVSDNIVNIPIKLVVLLPPIAEEIKSIEDVYPVLKKRVLNSIKIARNNPAIQSTATVATPVIALTAVSTVTLLATSFNAVRFLQYIFTAPFMLFKRRRRKKWGVVYDSLRKIPVDLAIVRLMDVATNRVVKSQVTDKAGRFLFVVDPGVYKIEVRKAGFNSPTRHLQDLKVDGDYLDLYHGENIEVNEKSAAIAINIPVDTVEQEVTVSRKSVITKIIRRTMYAISVIGAVMAIGVSVVDTSAWTVGLAVGQVIVLGLFIKLAIPAKPKSWGIVYDEKTRRPLGKAIVRIFDPKYNKLLETQITDSRGRYAFLVGPSEYYTTYEKQGFQKVEVRPIDRTDTKEASYVSINIPLNKSNNQHKES